MIGLDNPIHLLFLLVVLLLVFGAKRLPEMGRSLGEGLKGFKESINGQPSHPKVEDRSGVVSVPLATADDSDSAQMRPVA